MPFQCMSFSLRISGWRKEEEEEATTKEEGTREREKTWPSYSWKQHNNNHYASRDYSFLSGSPGLCIGSCHINIPLALCSLLSSTSTTTTDHHYFLATTRMMMGGIRRAKWRPERTREGHFVVRHQVPVYEYYTCGTISLYQHGPKLASVCEVHPG